MSGSPVALDEEQETAAHLRETFQPATTERKSSSEVPKSEPATAEGPPPEKVLLDALRRFVQQETRRGDAAQPPPAKIGLMQVVVVSLLVVDAAILYSLLESKVTTGFLQEVVKVVPLLLGSAWLTFTDEVRQVLLKQARHAWWVAVLAAIFVPLLIAKTPVFALTVRLPSQASVKSTDGRVKVEPEDGSYRLVSVLESYEIEVLGPEVERGYWVPFDVTLSRLQVLRATVGQLLHTGSREFALSPLYVVPTYSETDAQVEVESHQFQIGFFQEKSLTASGCWPVTARMKALKAVECQVPPEHSHFQLPSGSYLFTFHRKGKSCGPPALYTVAGGVESDEIDFDGLCAE